MSYEVTVWTCEPIREVLFRDHGIKMRDECMIFPAARDNRIEIRPCTAMRESDVPSSARVYVGGLRFATRLVLEPFAGSFRGRREMLRLARSMARNYRGVVEIGESELFLNEVGTPLRIAGRKNLSEGVGEPCGQ